MSRARQLHYDAVFALPQNSSSAPPDHPVTDCGFARFQLAFLGSQLQEIACDAVLVDATDTAELITNELPQKSKCQNILVKTLSCTEPKRPDNTSSFICRCTSANP